MRVGHVVLGVAVLALIGSCVAFALVASQVRSYPAIGRTWRVVLETPGGELPFTVTVINTTDDEDVAVIGNGEEAIRLGTVRRDWQLAPIEIAFEHYDSTLKLDPSDTDPELYEGAWTKSRSEGKRVVVPAKATRSEVRFAPVIDSGPPQDFSGRWRVKFSSSEDDAVAEFEVKTEPGVTGDEMGLASGTFLTTTGDYRYLAGRVDGNLLRLSTFDGAHAFLFKATLQPDGSLKGDFWSGSWWHETWTAVRDDDAALPDAMGQTTWRSDTELDELIFADLEGTPTSVAQAMDALDDDGARATALMVFGSWCPNCADATEYLVELQAKYHDQGLRVLGLAFELTGDLERDAKQVRVHQEHHGADWPVLVAGLSNKAKASKALPVLDRVRSYPTTIFMGPDREPAGIWTGFSGPATGEAHQDLRDRWEAMIEDLLGG